MTVDLEILFCHHFPPLPVNSLATVTGSPPLLSVSLLSCFYLSLSVMGFLHGASMDDLPDVILSDIFIRLQAKQLAQMRCVSKPWNALLSQSSFVKFHLNRSLQNNKNDGVLLVFPNLFSFASKPFSVHPSRSPHLELTNFVKLPVNPQSDTTFGKLIGSVNGLICFKYGSNHDSEFHYGLDPHEDVIYGSNHDPDVIYIWNPSLSALLTLPPYRIPSHSIQVFLRFGFDPQTHDYKVVKVSRRIEKHPDTLSLKEWLPVEIYSMRKGSWKLITQETEIPYHISYLDDCDDLCVDGHGGHLHWLAEINQNKDVETILAFDLGSEKFQEIPLPDSVIDIIAGGNVNYLCLDVAILAGKVCVISSALPDYECEVWVMNEYGVAESWVKLHDFPSFAGNLYTFGFTSQSEFFFQVVGGRLALYDPVAAKTKIFKLDGVSYKVVKVVEYVDSLVWVTPVEQCEMNMNCCSISQLQF